MHLPTVILWRIAEGPISYPGLMRLIRYRAPRILPDAVDVTIAALSRDGFIECVRQQWRIRCKL